MPADVFKERSAGRAWFRMVDLLHLLELVELLATQAKEADDDVL